jgi:hypothetical protein
MSIIPLTDEQVRAFGRRCGRGIYEWDDRFADWFVFSRSFGWWKWRKRLDLTDAQIVVFQKGFEEEVAYRRSLKSI